jgi:5'-3' exonuclease
MILIDASYLFHYRYNSTLKWYSFINKEIDKEKLIGDQLFMNKLLQRIQQTLDSFGENQVILCCDSKKNWRKEQYSFYKGTRRSVPGIYEIFSEVDKLYKNWASTRVNASYVRVDYVEADDIIFHIVQTNPDVDIEIIANDYDYLPLLRFDKVKIVNLKKEVLSVPHGIKPEDFLIYKILIGDKSDCIPSAFPKCGIKTALSILTDKEKLSNIQKLDQYQINRTLIDNNYTIDNFLEVLEKIDLKNNMNEF